MVTPYNLKLPAFSMGIFQRKMYRVFLLILMANLLISCKTKDMNTYQKNQIDELSVMKLTDSTLLLTIRPIMETLYSCPGVIIEENSNEIIVSIIRCRINKKCTVDISSTHDPMNPGSYNIILPSTDKPIKINYLTGGVIQVWPQL
jgi:hypothetical protein